MLSDWPTDLDSRHPRSCVAWLSLDAGDNDLARLLAHLMAALRGVGLEVDSAVPEFLHTASTSAGLTTLVNGITRAVERAAAQRRAVVLDDYHVIASTEIHEAMIFLLDHLPDQLHLVIATRSDPPLPLARVRSRGQLTEVRTADLRVIPLEAAAMDGGRHGSLLEIRVLKALTHHATVTCPGRWPDWDVDQGWWSTS